MPPEYLRALKLRHGDQVIVELVNDQIVIGRAISEREAAERYRAAKNRTYGA